jgi:uncharacterized membrane protein YidH (DUF202 family)
MHIVDLDQIHSTPLSYPLHPVFKQVLTGFIIIIIVIIIICSTESWNQAFTLRHSTSPIFCEGSLR